MKKYDSKKIIEKYLRGECSPEENAIIKSWYNYESSLAKEPDEEPDYEKANRKIWRNIQANSVKKTTTLYWTLAAAASLIIVLAFGFYLFDNRSDQTTLVHNKISPGKDQATLTLQNGQVIILDQTPNGKISENSGVKITKTKDGQLVYEVKAISGNQNLSGQDFNTITTPRGGQYQVILPDSTKVWLNAASSLKFPGNFRDNTRKVELSGEAYFEVQHQQSIPFIVKTLGQEVEVLGTHFNINAYPDEASIKTTLLEGSVRIRPNSRKHGVILNPGQQSRLAEDNLTVKKVNLENAVDWKDGYFALDNESLDGIMRKIGRWYNVEIAYRGKLPQDKLAGAISKFEDVTQVLSILEKASGAHFKIEGRRIVVMP